MHILGCRHRLTPVSSVKGSVIRGRCFRSPPGVRPVPSASRHGPATARRATEPAPPGQACLRRVQPGACAPEASGEATRATACSALGCDVKVSNDVKEKVGGGASVMPRVAAAGAAAGRSARAERNLVYCYIDINSNCIRLVRTLQLRSGPSHPFSMRSPAESSGESVGSRMPPRRSRAAAYPYLP